MQDVLEDSQTPEQPKKRPAVGEGLSAGSTSPFRDSSVSPPPESIRDRPTSAPGPEGKQKNMFETQRPHVKKRQLWTPQDAPTRYTSFAPSNIASV
jgi:hypothetical protein